MKARHRFRKSWGAEILPNGAARFRLWAPGQSEVALAPAGGSPLPMIGREDGWFETETDAVREGEGYSFRLADGMSVPDSAARAQVAGVHGPSRLVDPQKFAWTDAAWRGRPLEETVIYELHVGAFSPEGTFDGVRSRLDYLADLGVTAIELLPVAEFSGRRGWGYDGVCLYAPHEAYGGPEALKRLVDAAHARGLMMVLDVVYNHFGPEGNYLHLYAPDFFHAERVTPWGAGIAYEKAPVRAFFIENALYWLEEFRFDGLRLDAIDHIAEDDRSSPPFLEDLATTVRERFPGREIHLMTEDDRNLTALHERDADGRPRLYSTEWNDDFHHAAHQIATDEHFGYYSDYGERPAERLARALATGFIYQGDPSPYRNGALRGMPSAHLPPTAFLNFLQNHDQIGNRAFNERLSALAPPKMVEALTAILLLSPQLPLLFMGEEYGETRPFSFFTDFHGELARLVREGRRREFSKWPAFSDQNESEKIADPNEEATFLASLLDWRKLEQPKHRRRFALVRTLLDVRAREIAPLIGKIGGNAGEAEMLAERAFVVRWRLSGGGALSLAANLGEKRVSATAARGERIIHATGECAEEKYRRGELAPIAVVSAMTPAEAAGQ